MLGLGLYRPLTLGLGILENLLFSGVAFGWVSLVYVVKQEEYFSHLCAAENITTTAVNNTAVAGVLARAQDLPLTTPHDDGAFMPKADTGRFPTCPEQDAELQLVFTIATFCYEFFLFPFGLILDKFGTLLMRLISSCLIFTGLLLIALSSMETPYLLYPATSFLTIGGLELMISNMQISNLFGRRKATIMTFLSGCLDSSAFVFVLVKILYENFNVPLQTSFFVLAGACAILCLNTILLPKTSHIPYPLPPGYRQGKPQAAHEGTNKECTAMTGMGDARQNRLSDNTEDIAPELVKATPSSQSTTEAVKSRRYPSLCSCFMSLPAVCLLLWFSLLQLNMFFFLSTINPGLERLVDYDQAVVSMYTTALAIFQACSIFVAPFCGILLDRNRTKKAMKGAKRGPYDDLRDSALVFALTSTLYIVFNITLLIDVVELRYFSFVLHVITRSFMYSLVVTGCALFFPVKYFGSTSGLVEGAASLVGLLQRPMYAIQQMYLDNDPFWLFIVLIALNIVTFLLPVYIHFHVKRSASSLQLGEVKDSNNVTHVSDRGASDAPN